MNEALDWSCARVGADGAREDHRRSLAVEHPVAIECNGIGYAVLMASPGNLEDLGYGFVLSERLADGPGDVLDVDVHQTGQGSILRVALHQRVADRVFARVRHRATDSSCGLCGIENLEQALRPLPRLEVRWSGRDEAVFAAYAALEARQPLNDRTRAVHGAALCSPVGQVRLVREDVGRHNAFDKLIGAMARSGLAWDGGFALLTSRCSYELVEKAVIAGCPMLATISAPTSFAVDKAREAGLALRTLVRSDALLSSLE